MPVPPEIPIVDPSSPQFDDLLLIETISTTTGKYDDLPCGSMFPDAGKYPDYRLVLKRPLPGDEKWVTRYWTADPVAEDSFNLARQSFDEEDASKEVFTRHYLVRRTEYIAANIPAKLSSLTGVIAVRVTAGGSGYDATTTVTLTPAGGDPGTGATASPIIFRGVVVGIYMTAEGSGYLVAPTVTITGIGAAAAATARIQPVSAKLISEQANRMEGEPEDGLYLKITRVYHTLPGAIASSYSEGVDGNLKRTRRQKVALPALPTDTSANVISQKVTAIPELGTTVGIKETEDWVDFQGVALPSAPWITHAETIEPEGVKVVTRMRIVPDTYETPPMGQDYLVNPGDMAANGIYRGRRRVPTFPAGLTGGAGEAPGEWEYQQAYVVHSERRDIEDSPNKLVIVQAAPKPYDLYQFPNHTWQFPALLTYNTDTTGTNLALVNGKIPLRTSGGVDYTGHRTRTVVACLLQKFSIGQFSSSALSPTFYLDAPGAGSVFFGQIDANTIYANLAPTGPPTTVQIYDSAPALIEEFPFSSVSGCYPTTVGALPTFYRLVARCMPWKGNIWVREYLIVREGSDIVDDANNGEFDISLNGAALFDNA